MNIKGWNHSFTFFEGHLDSAFSNFFFLDTARLIEAKFYVEPPWDESEYKWFMSHDQGGYHVHMW